MVEALDADVLIDHWDVLWLLVAPFITRAWQFSLIENKQAYPAAAAAAAGNVHKLCHCCNANV